MRLQCAICTGFGLAIAYLNSSPLVSQSRNVPAIWISPTTSSVGDLKPISRYRDNIDFVIDRKAFPQFLPIGELETVAWYKDGLGNAGHHYGTGFLISPCYVITNNHVVFSAIRPEPEKDYSLLFRVGLPPDGKAFLGNTKAIPVVWGTLGAAQRDDWAILKLTTCVGARPDIGWMEASELPASEVTGKKVGVAGYTGDHSRGVLSFGIGLAGMRDRANGMFRHSASSAPGESGAPVMINENGVLKVLGIDTLEFLGNGGGNIFDTYTERFANEFTAIAAIFKNNDIKAMIENDRRRVGHNPARLVLDPTWPEGVIAPVTRPQ